MHATRTSAQARAWIDVTSAKGFAEVTILDLHADHLAQPLLFDEESITWEGCHD
ncbi:MULTISPECIES: hypothetical protein [Pseudomonas]|uniref:Uncharacterized protein n=1 Tax=Phytopseudomonas flavescens TaxID=29435 RepID=A0A7Y9XMJ8_9GAMM|nr:MULTISPECIES: hypothetical protein [Pseudomonas]MCW2292671.1 hypothetical protein [Pseudomonas sp. BIGb0408]NYH72759.1 hypothetical protein [Pseudomonas flavescens]